MAVWMMNMAVLKRTEGEASGSVTTSRRVHYAGSYGAWNYQRMRFYKYAAPTVLESNFAQGITTNPARHEGGEEIGSGTIIPLFT